MQTLYAGEAGILLHIFLEIYDLKIDVVPFIINVSTELTTVVKCEGYVQK